MNLGDDSRLENEHCPEKINNILWTGGWDSTFRVLDLVFRLRRSVQPFYLIDNRFRRCADIEQETMERIRSIIGARSPETLLLIRQLVTLDIGKLGKADDFWAAHTRLRLQGYLGKQYIFIAKFAQQYGVNDLQLSIHKDDRAYGFIRPYVKNVRGDGGDEWFELRSDAPDDVRCLFGNLRFPILETTKIEMEKIAKMRGYSDILEETWFCHTPTKKKTPCGVCHPCTYTIQEGLSRRVPFVGRVRYLRNQALNAIAGLLPEFLGWRFRKLMSFLRKS